MGKRILAAFGVVAPMEAQLRAPYRQAVAEDGRLVVFTGGDRSGQDDDCLKNAFEKTFPKTKVDIADDLSKNHDARVDRQAAEHHVVTDVVHLQTLDDFPRWKKEGSLENYTPVGWNKVHPQVKELTGTYRFDHLKKPLAQHPRFVGGASGTPPTWWVPATTWRTSAAAAATAVSRRSPCPASPPGWPGRRPAPLLKNAPHQAADKLHLSRLLSKDAQEHAIGTWSARTDVAPPAGRKGIFDHATMNPLGLGQFMSDRAALDRYEARLSLYIGDVHGANSSDPTSSASTRSASRAPKAEPLLDTGCPPRPGSRRTPRREAISPTITLHPRKHA